MTLVLNTDKLLQVVVAHSSNEDPHYGINTCVVVDTVLIVPKLGDGYVLFIFMQSSNH